MNRITNKFSRITKKEFSKNNQKIESIESSIFDTKKLFFILCGVWTCGLYVSQKVWYEKELSSEKKELEEYSTFFKASKTRFIRIWNEELKFVSKKFNEEINLKNEREKEKLKNDFDEIVKIEIGENKKIKKISTSFEEK